MNQHPHQWGVGFSPEHPITDVSIQGMQQTRSLSITVWIPKVIKVPGGETALPRHLGPVDTHV